jgi:hypothetical protein
MHVALLLVASAAVVAGGILAAGLLQLDDALDWTLAAAVLSTAEIVVVSLLAGVVLHRFQPGVVALLACGTSGILLLGRLARRQAQPRPRLFPALADVLRRLAPWQLLVCAVAAVALVWRLFLALVVPPFAYDALAYHLPAVAYWVQTRRIAPDPYAFCCSHYPANAEVLFAWPTVLLHSDALTQTVQIGLAIMAGLAVAGLARLAGAEAPTAATAFAVFLVCPIVLTQSNTNYNDVAVVAFLLCGLYFAAAFLAARPFAFTAADAPPPRTAHLVVASVSLGLLLGTKDTGVVMATVLAILLLAQLLFARARGRVGRTAAVRAGVLVLGPLVALGGFWYLRNWVQDGNPFWPFRVAGVFDGPLTIHSYLTVPPGGSRNVLVEVARSWYHDLAFWTRGDYTYETRDGGLGPLWSWVGWWAALWLAVEAVRRRRAFALNVAMPLALFFALEPYRWWARFTLYLAGAGAIAIAILLQRLSRGPTRTALAVVTVLLAFVGVARATWWLNPAGRAPRLDMQQVVSVALHPSRPHSIGSLFFHEYAWLDDVPQRATIAFDSRAPAIRFPYPLFGRRLDRHLVPISRGAPADAVARMHPAPAYVFLAAGSRYDRWARSARCYRAIYRGRGVAAYQRHGCG